ncbi:Phosphate regulon transcriptional regulatory protein PhoB [Anaerolineae bacterium]|nr:Phosphate regulon transcriptional regulatory protein PhoB [Anaerolineae bacterium]
MDLINAPSKNRILVVEDDRDVASVICLALEDFYDVALAENVAEAIRTLHATPFDLVLLDWRLGHHCGQEVLNELERLHSAARPQVVITSGGEDADLLDAIDAGKVRLITKPFGIEDLVRTVTLILSGTRRASAESDHRGNSVP